MKNWAKTLDVVPTRSSLSSWELSKRKLNTEHARTPLDIDRKLLYVIRK